MWFIQWIKLSSLWTAGACWQNDTMFYSLQLLQKETITVMNSIFTLLSVMTLLDATAANARSLGLTKTTICFTCRAYNKQEPIFEVNDKTTTWSEAYINVCITSNCHNYLETHQLLQVERVGYRKGLCMDIQYRWRYAVQYIWGNKKII